MSRFIDNAAMLGQAKIGTADCYKAMLVKAVLAVYALAAKLFASTQGFAPCPGATGIVLEKVSH